MRRSRARSVLWLLLAVATSLGFYESGKRHGGYVIPCSGLMELPASELMFAVWFMVWGSATAAFLSLALVDSGIAMRLHDALRALLSRPPRALALSALAVLGGALCIRWIILQGQAVTDDELTYELIMRTLLEGRVTNSPAVDPEFLANQFVIVGTDRWHGKYTIGHPLMLALFESVGLRFMFGAAVGAATVVLTYLLGRRVFDEKTATAGALLLAISPQFIWTHGTELSQPSSAVMMLLAALLTLRLLETMQARWALAAGAAWGFGLLVRPMPMAPMIAVAGATYLLHARRQRVNITTAAAHVACAGLGVLAGAGAIVAVNAAQSGDPMLSGYHAVHPELGLFFNSEGAIANSLGGALLRQSLWLFGWPMSLAFLPFARSKRHALMFWGLLAADYLYRVLFPKTVVSVTGPIYVFEAVPLLCLGTAEGARRVARLLSKLEVEHARAWVCGVAAAGVFVATTLFAPPNLRTLFVSGLARSLALARIEKQTGPRVVVFADELVDSRLGVTWAYFPPNPSPGLDDDMLFLRLPRGPDGLTRAWNLWRERYADRPAVVYVPRGDRGVVFPFQHERPSAKSELAQAIASQDAAASTPQGP